MKVADLKVFDAAEVIRTEEDMMAYLGLALEDGDVRLIKKSLHSAARVRGISQVARDAGFSVEGLCIALCSGDNLDCATFMKVFQALGFKLVPVPAE